VDAVVRLMDTPDALGNVINVGSDRPVSIRELAEMVIALSGSSSAIQLQSYTEAYDADFEDVRRRVPDLSKLKRLIDYQPRYRLEDIIRQMIPAVRGTAD